MVKSKSIGLVHRKGPAPTHEDWQYLVFDPGAGDDFPHWDRVPENCVGCYTKEAYLCWLETGYSTRYSCWYAGFSRERKMRGSFWHVSYLSALH